MIKILNLTIKNFLSVGNVTQGVNFTNEHLTLVLGENLDLGGDDSGSRNGVGKSAIVNAISYALFGQALTNIKKDNLINNINKKNMLVTIDFEKDGTLYRIERGRRPGILKFSNNQNTKVVDVADEDDDSQGDSRETQKDINKLLGLSHDMFKHIVALNTYTEPFLSLKSNPQRVIIEELLGITLLSEKAELLKEQIKTSKDIIFQENALIEAIKKSNLKIQESIDSLKTKQSAWKNQQKQEIKKIEKAIAELSSVDIEHEIKLHEDLATYNELFNCILSLRKEKSTLESAAMQAEKTVKKYHEELDILKDHKCPACEQELHTTIHNNMIKTATDNLKESREYQTKILNDISLINQKLEEIGELSIRPEPFYETIKEAYNHRTNLDALETQLKNKQNENDSYQEQINELKNTALQEISWDKVNEATALKDHQEFLLKLLTNKDSFIRKRIIDQNLTYLNNRLTYYLDRIGLPHTVTFQNDLSVEITQLGQNLDFDNLSRGERNRLIISLSLAFRDVWEHLYQSINLMFVDELIDSGLDSNGVESALGILKGMARDRNKTIYLISHRDELVGRVNNVLKVSKENGFTSFNNCLEVYEQKW